MELKSFETNANKVEKSLQRMSDAFSGTKIIQDAHLMTGAMVKAGGITALTDTELRKLNATVTEAADKMRRMGLEVPPGFKKIQDAAANLGSESKKTTSVLSGMASQLAGMFTIGAVVAFGREILRAGDQIQKMADQTGLTVEEVQKLQHIAGQSGTSIESLVGAVQNLQQRLGDDNSGAAGAIKRLGVNLDDLKSQNPYQQMVTLAEGIRGIKDPTEQASAAAAIFGKSWKEILPAIKSGMKDVGEQAPKMSDEVVKSLDRIGDALTKAKSQGIVWGATFVTAIEKAGFAVGDFISRFSPEHFGVANSQLLKMQAALNGGNGLVGAMSQAEQAAAKLGKVVGADVKPVLEATWQEEDRFNKSLQESVVANEKAAAANKKAAEVAERVDAGLERMRFGYFKLGEAALAAGKNVSGFTIHAGEFVAVSRAYTKELNAAQIETDAFGHVLPVAAVGLGDLGKGIIDTGEKVNKLAESLKSFPSLLIKAFTGGGGIKGAIKALGAQIGSDLFGEGGAFAGATKAATKGLTKVFGDTVGGALGAAIPGIGALIGPAFSALAGWIGSLFGNKTKDAIVESFGSYDALRKKLGELGAEGERMWIRLTQNTGRNDLASTKAQLEEINKALGLQATAMQNVEETAKKYGLTIAELGPAWAKQELEKKAQELFKDYQILTSAGVDHLLVLQKMSGTVNEYVNNALKMGQEVPEAMRPMLEAMIQNGQLLDANGNKVTSLEAAGVKFAISMSEGFKMLVSEVQRLTEIIARGLGVSLDTAGRKGIDAGDKIADGMERAADAAYEAADAVNAVSYGHSPGGLKDIIAMAPKASKALLQMSSDASANLKDLITIITDISDGLVTITDPPPGANDDGLINPDGPGNLPPGSTKPRTPPKAGPRGGGGTDSSVWAAMLRELVRIRQLAEHRGGAYAMAAGGSGRVTKPTLFLAGEAGPENFAFGKAVGGDGVGWSALRDEVARLRNEIAHERRSMRQGLKDILLDPAILAAAAR